eukprot:Seg935.5 transcript_id=Seg935.5/GoldUCD/mRNA.D3Y31 product="Paternally-expressed gene 3 protein" protein_id=Seg935.5/GoldUCD/D3Y31
MTNTRAVLLVVGNASFCVVNFIMFTAPLSASTKYYYILVSRVVDMLGVVIGSSLYFRSYRSIKRTVENLDIETNIGKETEPAENLNAIEEGRGEKNENTGNYPHLRSSDGIVGSCKDRSARENEQELSFESPDTVRNGPGNVTCADVSNNGRGKVIGMSNSTTGSGLSNDTCAEASNNFPEKDPPSKRTNNAPNKDPCTKAVAVAENDMDMLVDDGGNGLSADPCGTAQANVNNELRIDVDPEKNFDNSNEERDKVLFQGTINENQCHNSTKDVTFEITKPLEKRFEARRQEPCNISSIEEPRNISSKQEPHNISSIEEPRNISSKQEPRNLSWKQEPCDISSKEEPLSISSKEEPRNISSKQEPRNLSSKQEPCDISSKEEPLSISSKEEPRNISSKQEPRNISSKQEPRNISSKEEPRNISSKQEPLNISSKEEPRNISSKQEPHNISSKQEPRNISSKQEPHNISSKQEPRQEPRNISSKQEPRNISSKQEPRNILRCTLNALQNNRDLELAKEEQYINETNHVSKHSRGATVDEARRNVRRRADQEFAKAVLLINIAIVVCYVPGLLLYYFWLLLPMTDSIYVHGLMWCTLLNYLTSTLNAIIFISCSSELRLYTKSFFTRIME